MTIPCEAYSGPKPYIFVSYTHKDKAIVYPEIEHLHNAGYKVWYDEGIPPTSEWPEEIGKAIKNCRLFLVFITPLAVKSIHVRNEIYFASHYNKPILAVYNEKTDVPVGIKLQLSSESKYNIMKFEMLDNHYYNTLTNILQFLLKYPQSFAKTPVISKTVKCPTHGSVVFNIDLENEEIKNNKLFTLKQLHEYNQTNYLLQVTFDQQLNARDINCFDIQESEEKLSYRAKEAEIRICLETVKNKDQYSNWNIIFCGTGRFPLVDHIHDLIYASVTHYKKNDFIEVLGKLMFTSVKAPSPAALKRIIRRQELRGILLIVNPRGNIIEYIKSATFSSPDNLCIGICPVDREGKLDIRKFMDDLRFEYRGDFRIPEPYRFSGRKFKIQPFAHRGDFIIHRKPNQVFGFWRLDPSNPTVTTQNVLFWMMGFELES